MEAASDSLIVDNLIEIFEQNEEEEDTFPRLEGFEDSKAESERILIQKCNYLTTMFFQEQRHIEEIVGNRESLDHEIWARFNGKERMKTISVAMILCLHLGVDPPDPEPRPKDRARIEAWIDPKGWSPQKATSAIGYELRGAYARLQPRARYKVSIDPTQEDLKKICTSLRKNAKEERVLFHYNGHGVPRPTKNGEIWVFNQQYTQYIPVSICLLQTWIEFPCVYVWDCSSAGNCIENFVKFADQHMDDWEQAFEEFKEKKEGPLPEISSNTPYIEQAKLYRFTKPPNFKDCVHLAACGADERLPIDPRLPADLFTSCLTTPIQTSILWYLIKLDVRHKFPEDIFAHIPGQFTDRKTLMGELNWIFTAVTDTIAWNCLPRDVFQKLFRQDLLLASLFRSFLLAEKIMGHFGCTVQSIPVLPTMANHPLWLSWETALDYAIDYLDKMIYGNDPRNDSIYLSNDVFAGQKRSREDAIDKEEVEMAIGEQSHWFFVQQMRAFQTWLEGFHDKDNPPQQLPVVLQVLLSQQHRTHALLLLSKFLDLGTWAVGYALSVGIFPYILKLLQSTQRDLKPWLSFIWAKILAVEPDINRELLHEIGDETVAHHVPRTDNRHLRIMYFHQILNDPGVNLPQKIPVAYVLAQLFNKKNANILEAHQYLTERLFVNVCTEILEGRDSKEVHLLSCWLLIGLAKLWTDFNTARWQAIRLTAHEKVISELSNPVAEVRASACYALGALLRNHSHTNEHATVVDQRCGNAIVKACLFDGSTLVKEEMIMALQFFVIDFEEILSKNYLKLLEDSKIDFVEAMLDEEVDEDTVDAIAQIDAEERASLRSGTKRPSSQLGARIRKFSSSTTESGHRKDGMEPRANGIEGLSSRDRGFRIRVMKQIENLESRNFMDRFHRIWLALLRITLDPIPRIGELGQLLVRRIEDAALEYRVSVERRLLASVSAHNFKINGKNVELEPALRVSDSANALNTPNKENPEFKKTSTGNLRRAEQPPLSTSPRNVSLLGRKTPPEIHLHESDHEDQGLTLRIDRTTFEQKTSKTLSSPQLSKTSTSASSNSLAMNSPISSAPTEPRAFLRWMQKQINTPRLEHFDKNAVLAFDHHFQPKRTMTGRTGGSAFKGPQPHPKAGDPIPIYEPIVENEFVAWLANGFSKPCINLVVSKTLREGVGDKMNTAHHPTTWAQTRVTDAKSQAVEEFESISKGYRIKKGPKKIRQNVDANVQLIASRTERPMTACTFSELRPYMFGTDGQFVSIFRYDRNGCKEVSKFHNYAGNNFMEDHAIWMESINPESQELLMIGSSNGIVRIWNPSLDLNGEEIKGEEKMISAFNPIGSAMKSPFNMHQSTKTPAVYSWDQPTGRLVVAGSSKVVRLWDAHCETHVYEIQFDHKRHAAMTAVAADMGNSSLFAVGFREGAIRVYDQRLPAKESRAFKTQETGFKTVGLSLRSDITGNPKLCAAFSDGTIQVYEPRMYNEAVVSFKSESSSTTFRGGSDRAALSHFSVHHNGQLMCAANRESDPEIIIYDISGKEMTRIQNNEIESRRMAYPTCLGIHPLRALIGVGTNDRYLSAYGVAAR